jgi:RNA polymerase sigma-70 factor, ECF subfamily
LKPWACGRSIKLRLGAALLVTNQPPQQSVDDDIRQNLAAGQRHEAFERLVERYSAKVFHLAYSMIGNETQAEDMTQEVLLRIWKGLPGYHGGASLSTWIYAIARNTCLTELKRRAQHPTISLDEPAFAAALDSVPALQSSDPESGLELDVRQMLSQLPEKYRQVITLFYLEQKSYETVAALLGVPLGTVKTFLYRAKRELLKINSRRAPAPGRLYEPAR